MQSQIHGLWQAVEDKKEEVAQLTRQVGEEERKLAVDKALDTQVRVPPHELLRDIINFCSLKATLDKNAEMWPMNCKIS